MDEQDKRIIECANELIKAVKESSRETAFAIAGEVRMPVVIDVKVFDHYDPSRVVVENIHNGWEVHGDYQE
jgi:hypothetical protein